MRLVPTTAAALLVAGCGASSLQPDIDQMSRNLDQAIASSAETASTRSPAEFARLKLPVTDHLSAVQYCAFRFRNIDAADRSLLDAARARSGFGPAQPALARDVAETIDFDALFPTLRDPPVFDRKLAGAPVYIGSDVGSCTVLTLGEPGAAERTRAWLTSPASGWVEARTRRGSPWRGYKVRNPTLLQSSLVIFEAVVPEGARKKGVVAVHVVAMTGLP